MIRAIKSALVLLLGLQVTVFALNNIVNLDIALSQVSYVLSQAEHTIYPTSLAPALTSDGLATLTLYLIIGAELVTGIVLLKGGTDMARALRQPAEGFEAAKSTALLGALLAIGVWFGLFMVMGGALYQMWQTPLGRGSFNDSFSMVVLAGLLFLIIRSPDGDAAAR